ncbi:MAG: glycosyltransferase family 39 protein [Candidatus Aenigmatarchaeota archaeon]
MEGGKKEITLEIKSPITLITLVILFVFFYFNLQATFPNPIVFGDEAFHVTLSEWMASHEEYPKYVPFEGTALIREGFYRPPLWNLLLASFYYIFGISDIIPKILTPLITFFLGIAVFVFIKRLYDENAALIASLLVVAFPSVITYTIFFYYAALLLLFSTLSLLSFLIYIKEENKKFLILFALFASLALLTNQVALSLYALFIIHSGLKFLKEKNLNLIKKLFPSLIILILIPFGFIIRNLGLYGTPICTTIPYFHLFNTTDCRLDKFDEKYQFTGQAIPVGTEQTVFSFGLLDYINFAYGNPWLIALPFSIGFILMYLKRAKEFLIFLIFLILLIAIFPRVSQRAEDTARYTLIWSPLFAIVASLFYSEFYKKIKTFNKYLPILVTILILYFIFIGIMERTAVLSQIKFAWKDFVESCKKIDKILPKDATIYTIWGHNAAHSCKRNIASNIPDVLLSYDVNYTLKVLKENKIDYLFIQKSSIDFENRGYADNYPIKFIEMLENNKNNFAIIYEDGAPLQQCLQQRICSGNILYEIKYED